MGDSSISKETADAINEQMVRQMELRRQQQPERRQRAASAAPARERRAVCSYCFQHGDHPTPVHCLRALEGQSL